MKIVEKLPTQVIGAGAAGGKVVKELLDDKIISSDNCIIINSTDQDKPAVNCKFINIGKQEELGGCAKEPDKGTELCKEALQNGTLDIEGFIKADTRKVYIIASLEGGTGCGSSKILAPYISQVLGVPVHIIMISGFEEDPRGLKNTIQFIQSIGEDITVSIVCNKKYLKKANGDKLKAERLCNRDIAIMISVLDGNMIIPSDKNIDSNDLFKLSTKEGFTNVSQIDIDDKVRNVEQFNAIIRDMIDNSKSMDITNPKQTTMGVFINLPEDEQMNIDYSYSVLKEFYNTEESECYEVFTHVQWDEGMSRYIAFVNAGMQLPLDEIQRMYNEFLLKKKKSESVKKDKQAFFDQMQEMQFSDDENDLSEKRTMSSNDFFANFGGGTKSSKKSEDKLDNF